MRSNVLALLLTAISAQSLSPDYNEYYQNNTILVALISQYEGNLSLANSVVQNTALTHLQMANGMTPYVANMRTNYLLMEPIFEERSDAWNIAKFHMAQRERLLTRYIIDKNEAVKSSYQRLIKFSNGNLSYVFANSKLNISDLSLAYAAHGSFFGLEGVYLTLGGIVANKRDRVLQLEQLIAYLKVY